MNLLKFFSSDEFMPHGHCVRLPLLRAEASGRALPFDCSLVRRLHPGPRHDPKHRPTRVLMDVRLARGGDGVRAMDTIRSDLPVPVIFCTAHAGDAGFRDRTATLERSAVLSKPVREDLLKSAIGDLIGLPA